MRGKTALITGSTGGNTTQDHQCDQSGRERWDALQQMVQRLQVDGAEPAGRMSPEQLKAAIAREYAEIEQTVKRLNIRLQ